MMTFVVACHVENCSSRAMPTEKKAMGKKAAGGRIAKVHAALAAASAAAPAVADAGPQPTPGSDDEWAAAHQQRATLGGAGGLSESQIDEWCSRGMVAIPEEQIGLPAGWHDRLRETCLNTQYGMYDFCDKMPIAELLRAPGVEAGVASLLGPDWAIVPFANGSAGGNKTGPADGSPGGDQHWCGASSASYHILRTNPILSRPPFYDRIGPNPY